MQLDEDMEKPDLIDQPTWDRLQKARSIAVRDLEELQSAQSSGAANLERYQSAYDKSADIYATQKRSAILGFARNAIAFAKDAGEQNARGAGAKFSDVRDDILDQASKLHLRASTLNAISDKIKQSYDIGHRSELQKMHRGASTDLKSNAGTPDDTPLKTNGGQIIVKIDPDAGTTDTAHITTHRYQELSRHPGGTDYFNEQASENVVAANVPRPANMALNPDDSAIARMNSSLANLAAAQV